MQSVRRLLICCACGPRQAACDALITIGNSCERRALREFVKKGETVVGDRYYGLEYGFFGELRKLGASFVMRIRNEPLMEIMEELPLTEADRVRGYEVCGSAARRDRQRIPSRNARLSPSGAIRIIGSRMQNRMTLIFT